MKTAEKRAAQGELLFRRVNKIPKGAVQRAGDERIVVGHSETGHHHVVETAGVGAFDPPGNPMICYLQIGDAGMADIVHLRGHDTHETIRLLGLPGDVWEVRRQREHTPEGWIMVRD